MLRTIACVVGLFAITVLAAWPAPANDAYIDDIAAAAVHIEHGDYNRAVEDVNSAFTKRSGEPLAHIALGIVFLHTRQADRAFKEFTTARALDEHSELAAYGLALYYLASGKRDAARDWLYKASADGAYDVQPVLSYLAALSGEYPEESAPVPDPVLAQIRGYRLFKQQKYRESREILSPLVAGVRGFNEEFSAVTTFNPASPVSFAGRQLSKPYKSPSEAEPGLKKVTGAITLRADLARSQGISYVLFFVDDKMIGMINHTPYECNWDTTSFANAPHAIRIQGFSTDGIVTSEKSIRVIVSNKRATASGPVDGDAAVQAERKLWESLRLKPSRRLSYYLLAKCAEAVKDGAAAVAALEHVVGIDPDYRDARSLLISKYAPLDKYREIWQTSPKSKMIAITFDDGPTTRTGELLDILVRKGVKATFFVVGSMAEARPETLRRMAAEGHQIENHTYSHRNLEFLSPIEVERELIRTNSVIRDVTGGAGRLFRLPGGHHNGKLSSSAGKFGFRLVFWTVNCSKTEGTKVPNILKLVTSKAKPGGIILMHNGEDVTLLALPKVIDALKVKGYKLVTLKEMMAAAAGNR